MKGKSHIETAHFKYKETSYPFKPYSRTRGLKKVPRLPKIVDAKLFLVCNPVQYLNAPSTPYVDGSTFFKCVDIEAKIF